MRVRDSIALTLPSFFLRLVLGATFLWAGSGKLLGTMSVSGDDAARLANLGVPLTPFVAETPANTPDPEEPISPLPSNEPTLDPQSETESELEQQANDIIEQLEQRVEDAADDAQSELPDEQPASPPAELPTEEPTESNSLGTLYNGQHYVFTRVQNTNSDRTASDYPEPMQCQRVYSIALMISKAADPGLTADSQPITPIMPTKLASNPWPKVLAWCAAITEIIAGAFLVLGLLTRISALSTFFVMLVAMWMTQIGPAALHSSDALLGFIPNNQPWYDPSSYASLLWQVALASMSLAVVFLGSGAIGLDRVFFSQTSRDPYLHGDPKAKKHGSDPAAAQRTEFDRSPSSE
jgi:uncharacterized membrane protein YphA (DoxX/SURF4 family)